MAGKAGDGQAGWPAGAAGIWLPCPPNSHQPIATHAPPPTTATHLPAHPTPTQHCHPPTHSPVCLHQMIPSTTGPFQPSHSLLITPLIYPPACPHQTIPSTTDGRGGRRRACVSGIASGCPPPGGAPPAGNASGPAQPPCGARPSAVQGVVGGSGVSEGIRVSFDRWSPGGNNPLPPSSLSCLSLPLQSRLQYPLQAPQPTHIRT